MPSPRDSSLVAHTSTTAPTKPRRERDTRFTWMSGESYNAYCLRRGKPYVPPPPEPADPAIAHIPKPERLTDREQYLFRRARYDNHPMPPEVYNRILEWCLYAEATNTRHPINVTRESLIKLKPPGLPDPTAPPSDQEAPPQAHPP